MNPLDTLKSWWHSFDDPEPATLDHVPVGHGMSAKKIAKARADAARRHGKPFRADIIKPRETEPSRDLQDLMRASNRPAGTVSTLKRASK